MQRQLPTREQPYAKIHVGNPMAKTRRISIFGRVASNKAFAKSVDKELRALEKQLKLPDLPNEVRAQEDVPTKEEVRKGNEYFEANVLGNWERTHQRAEADLSGFYVDPDYWALCAAEKGHCMTYRQMAALEPGKVYEFVTPLPRAHFFYEAFLDEEAFVPLPMVAKPEPFFGRLRTHLLIFECEKAHPGQQNHTGLCSTCANKWTPERNAVSQTDAWSMSALGLIDGDLVAVGIDTTVHIDNIAETGSGDAATIYMSPDQFTACMKDATMPRLYLPQLDDSDGDDEENSDGDDEEETDSAMSCDDDDMCKEDSTSTQ